MEDDVQQLVEQTKATLDLILRESQELPIEAHAEPLHDRLHPILARRVLGERRPGQPGDEGRRALHTGI